MSKKIVQVSVSTLVLLFVATPFSMSASAQSPDLEHTYRLDAPDMRPSGSLADAERLIGNWVGEAFGKSFEAVWNPPSAGSMVGMFKLLDGDNVMFYELLLLVEEEDSLSLLVKHFSPDFTAWEDKEDHIEFRLAKTDDGAIHFAGLSFYFVGDNEMHGYLVMHSNGERREEKLIYRRRD